MDALYCEIWLNMFQDWLFGWHVDFVHVLLQYRNYYIMLDEMEDNELQIHMVHHDHSFEDTG